MTQVTDSGSAGSNAPTGPMPPHGRIPDFLAEADRLALLDWAISHEREFRPAKVYRATEGRGNVDPRMRTALKLRDLGPLAAVLRGRLTAAFPQISTAAGYRGGEIHSIEFELNAYGEGAHFAPHVDIPVGPGRQPLAGEQGHDRVVSAVYYFHQEPKVFSGGALRLYRFGVAAEHARQSDVIDLEPIQNSLVIFPSWVMHSVETVHCPTGRFADFRFALNCWFCRQLSG